jgi:hypothetical protein
MNGPISNRGYGAVPHAVRQSAAQGLKALREGWRQAPRGLHRSVTMTWRVTGASAQDLRFIFTKG